MRDGIVRKPGMEKLNGEMTIWRCEISVVFSLARLKKSFGL
jgi:hypothetical protein